ncbi:MAG: pilin [bacterium]|nr:pilin [bacterium]
MMKKLLAGATGAAAYLLWAGQHAVVFAQTTSLGINRPAIGNSPIGPTDLNSVINALVQLAFIVAVILVFFFLVFGGIKWIISGGDQKKTEEARNMITAAIVGLAIVALAYAIVKVLEAFFKIPIFGQVALPTTQ